MADTEKTEAAPESMDSELAGQTQAKRRAAKKTVARTDAATKTVDAGIAGRVGEQALASDPKPQESPTPGSNRSSVAPIDPITATPEIFGKAEGDNFAATPAAVLHPNYEPVRYVDANGEEITDADGLFEDTGMATKVRVTGRVSEIVSARNASFPHQRLLFSMGSEVDRSVAEAFKAALRK